MPELPEVEHARRSLTRWLAGRRVTRAEASPTRIFRGGDRRDFERALAGRTLLSAHRHGKQLVLGFDGEIAVLSHLGMTGRWLRRAPGEAPPSHSRARLVLDDGTVVHYDDPRLFGRIEVVPAPRVASHPSLAALGPDPLAHGVDLGRLAAALAKSSRAVKVALMDQRVIAGIGNIHATEALFRARIHPARPARSLQRAEVGALARGVRASIAFALRDLGEPGDDITYLSQGAAAQKPRRGRGAAKARRDPNPFLVYDRAGEPCPRCGHTLQKTTLGGRTSAFCPKCQPRRPLRA